RGRSVLRGPSIRRVPPVIPLVATATMLPVSTMPLRHTAHVALRVVGLRTQGRLRAPISFRMLGVTWPTGASRPTDLSVRTSTDGRHWSEWSELDSDGVEGPDIRTGEPRADGTSPLWVGHARF